MTTNIIEVPTFIPSRAHTRSAARNRRAFIKSALYVGLKACATVAAIFVRELFL